MDTTYLDPDLRVVCYLGMVCHACVRSCVRACMRVCMRACVRAHAHCCPGVVPTSMRMVRRFWF